MQFALRKETRYLKQTLGLCALLKWTEWQSSIQIHVNCVVNVISCIVLLTYLRKLDPRHNLADPVGNEF